MSCPSRRSCDAESLTAAVAAERAARRTLDLTLKQQQLGYTNYLALLSAQQAYQQTVITRVQAHASRFADTGALFPALGGGWWNRPDAAATPPSDRPARDIDTGRVAEASAKRRNRHTTRSTAKHRNSGTHVP